MLITKQQIDKALAEISSLIKKDNIVDAYRIYEEIDKLIKKINSEIYEKEDIEVNKSIYAKFYAAYAYFLFDLSEYRMFFEKFIIAQNYGYSQVKIKKFIYESFVSPNISDLKSNYYKNINALIANGCIKNKEFKFEDSPYWLVTTGKEKEFYIYDKNNDILCEKILLGCIDVKLQSKANRFSDYLIINDWNFGKIERRVASTNKKCYIIVDDILKLLSCLQGKILDSRIMEFIKIFDSFNEFENYFKESKQYLPKSIIGNKTDQIIAKKSIRKIHLNRIMKTKESRDNILLSICIPSYNRGNRAYESVMNILESNYDEEIEVILSNNGTQNETKEYYKKIQKINDSRLTYFEFEENMGYTINLSKSCELARGKFILLLSDEDRLNFDALEVLLNTIVDKEDKLAIVRAKSDKQGGPKPGYAKQGKEAILKYMLMSNYMSGITINNEMLKNYKVIDYTRDNINDSACFYYPHMVWELILFQYGDVQSLDMVLVNEGDAEVTEVEKREVGLTDKVVIPHYASIEGRMEQHKSFLNTFKNLYLCQDQFDVFREMYIQLTSKTMHLVMVSILVFYKKTDIEYKNFLKKTYDFCIKCLKKTYIELNKEPKDDFQEDIRNMDIYYDHYCNKLTRYN